MTSREKFEAWCKTVMSDDADFHMEWGMYANLNIRTRWEAWKASESASDQQLEESRSEFRAADATIHNLELQLTDMAVQLANAESKCRELAAADNNLIDSECHVAELEEALRDKQALLEALDNSLCEVLPGTQYMDPPDGGSVTPLEQVRRMVADYRERIAELESRTVNLPEALNSYAGVKIYRPNDVIEEIRAAGIGVKGE